MDHRRAWGPLDRISLTFALPRVGPFRPTIRPAIRVCSSIDLAGKLKVTPQDNPTSQALKAGGDKNLAALKALQGAAFDKAYVDHEVAYHQAVLDAVDKSLIPGAQNGELKALLTKVRPAFVAHLEHAKQLPAKAGEYRMCAPCIRR